MRFIAFNQKFSLILYHINTETRRPEYIKQNPYVHIYSNRKINVKTLHISHKLKKVKTLKNTYFLGKTNTYQQKNTYDETVNSVTT